MEYDGGGYASWTEVWIRAAERYILDVETDLRSELHGRGKIKIGEAMYAHLQPACSRYLALVYGDEPDTITDGIACYDRLLRVPLRQTTSLLQGELENLLSTSSHIGVITGTVRCQDPLKLYLSSERNVPANHL